MSDFFVQISSLFFFEKIAKMLKDTQSHNVKEVRMKKSETNSCIQIQIITKMQWVP